MARSQSNGAAGGPGAIALVVLSIAGIVYTLVAGNQPLLGLDLQGGVSVVYEPTTEASDETLDQTLEIIRERVDALGVAEPEISRQGQTIVVDLPGVDEQQRALDLVGQTAELRFRPVIADLGPTLDPELLQELQDQVDGTETTTDGTATTDGTDTTTADETTTTTTPGDEPGDDEQGLARYRRQQTTTTAEIETTTTTEPAATTTTTSGDVTDDSVVEPPPVELTPEQEVIADAVALACGIDGTTAPEDDLAENYVVLADDEGNRYCLGPVLLTGDALESADVGLDNFSTWLVSPVFKEGADGIDRFNEAASKCFVGSAAFDANVCPQTSDNGRLAIVLDRKVISAPSINAASFQRDQITISGSFTEASARDLALVLNYGALPVELEAQATRTVSATIGDDVLRAGIIAGLIGLGIVAVYLLWYYRLAGMVAIGGLLMSFLLIWTIISWLGESRGLAITLSGVVGLIVSIGVSTDSNIVYFENVKEAATSGTSRKLGTAVERAYKTAISTIVKADVVSLIAAALLYWLTVGAVRGFAFYLGLATLLDLVVSVVFMRPALGWIARRPAVQANPRLMGIRHGGAS